MNPPNSPFIPPFGQAGANARWQLPRWIPLVLAVPGCASAVPDTHHYRLSIPMSEADRTEAVGSCLDHTRPTLGIDNFEVAVGYDDVRMVYRESPYRLDHYDYHLWVAPPGELVSDALREGYDTSRWFAEVDRGGEATSDGTLRGRVFAIEEVDVEPSQWMGRVALQLEVVDPETEERLWSESFDVTRPLTDRSPTGLAEATSAALAQIVRSSAREIAQAVSQDCREAAAKGSNDDVATVTLPDEGVAP